jgi:quinol monooxygenase YgiN
MIVVRITLNALIEKQKELVQTILSLIRSMEKEAGCMSYAFFCSVEDRNLLNLIAEWRTRKDLNQHFNSEMFGILMGTKTLLDTPMQVQIHTVSGTEGMEAVHSARNTIH